ncbi:hypothetical protein HY450_03435 [Candidatus Pacearchaeota archaeon]|nr:hypothetical protein [Candidatus Pacearchaeota archaeon]
MTTQKPRHAKLYERAEKLEETAKQARRIAGNLFGVLNVSDDQNRIMLNNEGLGFSPRAWGRYLFGHERMAEAGVDTVIHNFAEAEEPLCSYIRNRLGCKFERHAIVKSAFLIKMLTRTMTEGEYNGLLNGTKPFGVDDDGKDLYLPYKREVASVGGIK